MSGATEEPTVREWLNDLSMYFEDQEDYPSGFKCLAGLIDQRSLLTIFDGFKPPAGLTGKALSSAIGEYLDENKLRHELSDAFLRNASRSDDFAQRICDRIDVEYIGERSAELGARCYLAVHELGLGIVIAIDDRFWVDQPDVKANPTSDGFKWMSELSAILREAEGSPPGFQCIASLFDHQTLREEYPAAFEGIDDEGQELSRRLGQYFEDTGLKDVLVGRMCKSIQGTGHPLAELAERVARRMVNDSSLPLVGARAYLVAFDIGLCVAETIDDRFWIDAQSASQ